MPIKKYRVDTDKGSYEIEVEEPESKSTISAVSKDEPGTFMGGAMRSINDDLDRAGKALFKSAAQPETLGDVMGLLLPTQMEAGAAGPVINEFGSRSKAALKSAAMQTEKGVGSHVTFPLRAVKNFKSALPSDVEKVSSQFRGGPPPARTPTNISRGGGDIIDRMLADERGGHVEPPAHEQVGMEGRTFNPSDARSGSPPYQPSETPFHEKPLYEQMGDLPDTAAPEMARGGGPPATGREAVQRSPADVRLAGKAPTVDDALMNALQDAMGGEKPMAVSHTPEPTAVGEGATKQSGKFKRSDSLGQAGGYSSGRPSTQPIEPVASHPQPAPLTAEEAAGDLRRGLGSRDAGAQLDGSPAQRKETIRDLAPGPSQTPFEAEHRIQDARGKAAQGTDDLSMEMLRQMLGDLIRQRSK